MKKKMYFAVAIIHVVAVEVVVIAAVAVTSRNCKKQYIILPSLHT